MIAIGVLKRNSEYKEYAWESKTAFMTAMKNKTTDIPNLDDVVDMFNTDDDELLSWWKYNDGLTTPITVKYLLNKCKESMCLDNDLPIYINDISIKTTSVNNDILLLEGKKDDAPLTLGTLCRLSDALPMCRILYKGRIVNIKDMVREDDKYVLHLENLYHVKFTLSCHKTKSNIYEDRIDMSINDKQIEIVLDINRDSGDLLLSNGYNQHTLYNRGLIDVKTNEYDDTHGNKNMTVSLLGTKSDIESHYNDIIKDWMTCRHNDICNDLTSDINKLKAKLA